MMSLNKTSYNQLGQTKMTTIHIASTEILSTRCKNHPRVVVLAVLIRLKKTENAKKERQKQKQASSD